MSQTTILRASVRLLQTAPSPQNLFFAMGPEISYTGPESNPQGNRKISRTNTNSRVSLLLRREATATRVSCVSCLGLSVHIMNWSADVMRVIYLKLVCSEWRLPSMLVQTARALDAGSGFEWLSADCCNSFFRRLTSTVVDVRRLKKLLQQSADSTRSWCWQWFWMAVCRLL